MGISLVYIVKNEEKNILKSIQSCSNIADEIIVVDTGSTDNTVKLCTDSGYKIYDFKWTSNFSEARNYAISLCNQEIILFLDADEYFIPSLTIEDKQIILENFNVEDIDGLAVFTKDIEKENSQVHYTNFSIRFFRNCEEISYKNSIHEVLYHTNRELKLNIISNLNLIHTGYSIEVHKFKIQRNIELLEQVPKKNTMDLFYLCREYLSLGEYEKSDYYYNQFFAQEDYETYIELSDLGYLIYFYRLTLLTKLKDKYQLEDIYIHLKTLQAKLPKIPETYYQIGLWYYDKDIHKAKNYFLQSIKINEEFNQNRFKLSNFESYQTDIYYRLAKISLLTNDRDEAIQRATVACMLDQTNENYLGLLISILDRGKSQKNIVFLEKIYKPKTKEDYEFLIKSLNNTDLREEFIYFAAKYHQDFNGTDESVFYAMMLTGYTDTVLSLLEHNQDEKSNFLKVIGLLYDDNAETCLKYYDSLSEKYQILFNKLHNQEKLDKEEIGLATVILAKLELLGQSKMCNNFELSICSLGEERDIELFINIYNNMSDMYGRNGRYIDSVNLFEYYEVSNDFTYLLHEYLFTLYKAKKYDKFVEVYNKYYILGLITKNNSYLYLVKQVIVYKPKLSSKFQSYLEEFRYAEI